MKQLSFLFLMLMLAASTAYSQEDKIKGYWLTDEGRSQIRIFKATNGKYYGEIAWMKDDPDKKDINNPDKSLRDARLLGMNILKGFSYIEDKDRWEQGTIYDPDSGKTYDCYMWFDNSPDVLRIKGYVLGMKFLGRETEWTRDKSPR